MSQAKPFSISKQAVWEAYQRVKAKKGAGGVDEQTIEDFEERLKDNLYKIWNRMTSGSYFPPPVRLVEIPKSEGRKRVLGIPTVSDRVAQMVAKMYLEPELEPHFHPDSYGYRPKKSAIEAVGKTRQMCWRYSWVLDLDIKGFFDNLDHELLMRAIRKHTESKWILLYIERWLKAPLQREDGTLENRDKGTPQGGVISPLLANLFLHYAFDEWMKRNHREVPFERYADDIVVHCKSEAHANTMKVLIAERLAECKLEINPEKTRIVYCKDERRKGSYSHEKFDFLGYTFRIRKAEAKSGGYFLGFNPAISDKATRQIRQDIRRWQMHRKSTRTLEEIAREINPKIRGWIQYYGAYNKLAMSSVFQQLDCVLIKWAMRKYKKLRGGRRKAADWLKGFMKRDPRILAHWQLGFRMVYGF